MGHNICALIGKQPVNEVQIRAFQLAVAFENGYAIVILDRDSIYYWADRLQLSFDSESTHIDWACELVFHFAWELGMERYAIIQTDYFGGIGDQCALLYENGKRASGEDSINNVLAQLGVQPKPGSDEFDALNLAAYRQTEMYYWNKMNFADGKPNMIAGSIPSSTA